ncbi:MAG: TlpA disulfide reductase family protein [Campylobacterales bacterium]
MFLRGLGTVLLLGGLLNAGNFSLLDYRLETLKGTKTVDLNAYRGKPLYLTFFKTECRWCAKQLSAFEKVVQSEAGTTIHVVAVALGNDTGRLQKMAERVSFETVRASEKLLHDIGGVSMTPYTLVTDAEGNFKTKIVGYQNSESLKDIISKKEYNR